LNNFTARRIEHSISSWKIVLCLTTPEISSNQHRLFESFASGLPDERGAEEHYAEC
jgi:hypothetical protein